MSGIIAWIAAEAERPEMVPEKLNSRERKELSERKSIGELTVHGGVRAECSGEIQIPHPFDQLRAGSVAKDATRMGHPQQPHDRYQQHGFEGQNPHVSQMQRDVGHPDEPLEETVPDFDWELERERKIYRARTVTMLRRYMRYSIETGRLPSLLGREFFRAKVTSYTVVTFEDRVIFVHDMERCLAKLDEFSRQLIARHILEEHDRWATARLLHCNEKTVRRLTPMALDVLSEILIEVGLLERLDMNAEKPCQGGAEGETSVSACEDGENKF